MYNFKSLNMLRVIIKACYVLLALALGLLYFVSFGKMTIAGEEFILFYENDAARLLFISFCGVIPAGYAALALIDKLLVNIKKDVVFNFANTKILSQLSIACCYAAVVGVVSIVTSCVDRLYDYLIAYIVLTAGEFFMALILQVIKLVFHKAITIKEENDLTV